MAVMTVSMCELKNIIRSNLFSANQQHTLRSRRLRNLEGPETGVHVHVSLGKGRPVIVIVMRRRLVKSQREMNVEGGRQNLLQNFVMRGPSYMTIAAGLRMTGDDHGLVTEVFSSPPGGELALMLADLVAIVGRDPVAVIDDGIPDFRVPDLPHALAVVVGATQDPARINVDSGQTAVTGRSVGDLLRRRIAQDVNRAQPVQLKVVEAQQVAADPGHQKEVGSVKVVPGQVLRRVRPAVNLSRLNEVKRKKTSSPRPRNRLRYFSDICYFLLFFFFFFCCTAVFSRSLTSMSKTLHRHLSSARVFIDS